LRVDFYQREFGAEDGLILGSGSASSACGEQREEEPATHISMIQAVRRVLARC
jgi:hypothetical protein